MVCLLVECVGSTIFIDVPLPKIIAPESKHEAAVKCQISDILPDNGPRYFKSVSTVKDKRF